MLICTDGLTDMVDATQIAQCLEESPDAQSAYDLLIDLALAGGGKDNVTAVQARAKGRACSIAVAKLVGAIGRWTTRAELLESIEADEKGPGQQHAGHESSDVRGVRDAITLGAAAEQAHPADELK